MTQWERNGLTENLDQHTVQQKCNLIYICNFECSSKSVSLVAQTVKNPPDNAGDPGSIPGSGRLPGEGNGYPLFQQLCMDVKVGP